MRKLSRALGIAVVLLLSGTAAASASDLCFQDSFGQVMVAKSLLLPTPNNCKLFNGFMKGAYTPLIGNVCKTHDGIYYIFNLQFGLGCCNDGGTVVFNLLSSTKAGAGRYLNWDTGTGDGFIDSFSISQVLCPTVRNFGP